LDCFPLFSVGRHGIPPSPFRGVRGWITHRQSGRNGTTSSGIAPPPLSPLCPAAQSLESRSPCIPVDFTANDFLTMVPRRVLFPRIVHVGSSPDPWAAIPSLLSHWAYTAAATTAPPPLLPRDGNDRTALWFAGSRPTPCGWTPTTPSPPPGLRARVPWCFPSEGKHSRQPGGARGPLPPRQGVLRQGRPRQRPGGLDPRPRAPQSFFPR